MAKQKEEKTNVMRILEQKGIPFTAHTFLMLVGVAVGGVTVAQSLGQDPECVFKTLVARGASKNIYVFVIPVADSLDLKKAARAVGEKSIEMVQVKEINALTGYIRGGCSPVGMKKEYTTTFQIFTLPFEAVLSESVNSTIRIPPRASFRCRRKNR